MHTSRSAFAPIFALSFFSLFAPVESSAQTFTNISSSLDYQDGSLHGAWGASFVDIDGNGRPDIYEPGTLYLQQADGTFVSSLEALGIPLTRSSVFGSVYADVDDDGFPEMFTMDLNTSASVFYKNHRGLVLADSTDQIGLESIQQSQGTVFSDFNGDGFVDMFMGEETGKNQLFFGNGKGRFTEGTANAGIDTDVRSYGVAATDFDNDGDLDVLIAACAPLSRELSINKFFRNNGDGTFEEIGNAAGVDDDLSSWGIVWLDYDRDGDMDTYIVNMREVDGRPGYNVLYRNNGDGTFTNVAAEAGAQGAFTSFSYGTSAADFNNDGWVDLYVSNRASVPYVLINNGDGTFTDRFPTTNIPVITNNTSIAVADLNGDGWLDFFTGGDFGPSPTNQTNQYSVLMLNDGGTNGFLTVHLIQEAPNKRGLGARLEVWDDGTVQLRDISAGDGFTSQNMDFSAHFGLGTATAVDSLVVKWPDKTRDRLVNVGANQHLYIQKGGTLNHPPTSFEVYANVLTSPAGKAEANFYWTASVDPEGETVQYVVTVATTEGKIVFESAPVETPYLSAEFDIDRTAFEYRWVVTATDGMHVRRSDNVGTHLLVTGDAVESGELPDDLTIRSAYPNPVSGVLRIQVDSPQIGVIQLEVIDLLGRTRVEGKVSPAQVGAGTYSLDLGFLPAGPYVLKVTMGDQRRYQSIVKF